MTSSRYIFFISFFTSGLIAAAQQPSSEKLDTTLSIFWNLEIKVHIQILNSEEFDPQRKNAVLNLFILDHGSQRNVFRDSLFAYTLQIKMMDLNGDGIRDLLIYNTNNGPENRSYHLYLVDQKLGRLTRVKGFEKVYNPYYDQSQCLILGFESFERKLILNHYQIDKKGTLSLTTWR